ncbi:MAG TPA: alpha/beta fold hydrolase [Acidimicrobiia bacterium]|nr:alpha/beta fold hydrolase [Acidimicrobiia bacterium]
MFTDRVEAGRRLAGHLTHLSNRDDVVVLGLPRGGVPVAYEVATRLNLPLDVIVVRKLGVPYQPELAMGAIGEEGVRILDSRVLSMAGVSEHELEAVEDKERAELQRRAELFRSGRPRVRLEGKVAVIVDDGIATGSTIKAAARVARRLGATRIVVAAPVAPPETAERLAGDADEVVIVSQPHQFYAIGQFYLDFAQTTDDEVTSLLARAPNTAVVSRVADPPGDGDAGFEEECDIAVGDVTLQGSLSLPLDSKGTVIFVHGSGSSRHSPRNRHVARALNRAGLGTLLFDLLTTQEERDRANVFDIELLANRLIDVTAWLVRHQAWQSQPLGYFGASTGAAAALRAAAEPGRHIAAVVSRGGRPDLTGPNISKVMSPTLLIVGSRDAVVLDLNREARAQMSCETDLEIIPGATHLFEEPGALDQVATLATRWFIRHFS